MNSLDQDLLFYLPLDYLNLVKIVPDETDNYFDAELVSKGESGIIPDPAFQRVLYLDGKQYLSIDADNTFAANSDSKLTFAIWIKTIVKQNNPRIFSKRINDDKGYELYLDKGYLEVNLKAKTEVHKLTRETSTKPINDGLWHHVALLIDTPNKTIQVYVDGKLYGQAKHDDFASGFANEGDLRIGGTSIGSTTNYFVGELACARAYTRLLTENELTELMQIDQTPSASYRRAHPIDFDLHYEPLSEILYFSITNLSARDITIKPTTSNPTSTGNFTLQLSPGSLSPQTSNQLVVAGKDWQAKFATSDPNRIMLFWQGATALHLESGETKTINFGELTCLYQNSLIGARARINYQSLYFGNEQHTELTGHLEKHIESWATEHIPLQIQCVPDAVLNDGSPNHLILRIHNCQENPIVFGVGNNHPLAKLRLNFPAQNHHQPAPWALVDEDKIEAILIRSGFIGKIATVNIQKKQLTLVEPLRHELKKETQLKYFNTATSKGAEVALTLQSDAPKGSTVLTFTTEPKPDCLAGLLLYLADDPQWRIDYIAAEACWEIIPKANIPLEPGEFIELAILNLCTNLENGDAELTLDYQGLPMYGSGTTSCYLTKTPLVINQNKVCIGTSQIDAQLNIEAKNHRVLALESNSTTGTWLTLNNTSKDALMWTMIATGSGNGEGAGKFLIKQRTNGPVFFALDKQGHVGIGGETKPEISLAIGSKDIGLNFIKKREDYELQLRYPDYFILQNASHTEPTIKVDKQTVTIQDHLLIKSSNYAIDLNIDKKGNGYLTLPSAPFEVPDNNKEAVPTATVICGGKNEWSRFTGNLQVGGSVQIRGIATEILGNVCISNRTLGPNGYSPAAGYLEIAGPKTDDKHKEDATIIRGGNDINKSSVFAGPLIVNGHCYLKSGFLVDRPSEFKHDVTVGGNFNLTGTFTCKVDGSFRQLGLEKNWGKDWACWTSDQQLKKDIKSISESLAKLQQLQGVHFNWNELGLKQQTKPRIQSIIASPDASEAENEQLRAKKHAELAKDYDKPQIGLIAQQVEQVFPELVDENEDGYKTVNYAASVAVLVQAINEQQQMIQKLQAEVTELQQQIKK